MLTRNTCDIHRVFRFLFNGNLQITLEKNFPVYILYTNYSIKTSHCFKKCIHPI